MLMWIIRRMQSKPQIMELCHFTELTVEPSRLNWGYSTTKGLSELELTLFERYLEGQITSNSTMDKQGMPFNATALVRRIVSNRVVIAVSLGAGSTWVAI
mmetsp:Transcript_11239/g.22120  ORF Transcript_11239/g.22120 Transcript_11239/m.22120 type:complete len:100 (+) Transcript_11239:2155-2454(+)